MPFYRVPSGDIVERSEDYVSVFGGDSFILVSDRVSPSQVSEELHQNVLDEAELYSEPVDFSGETIYEEGE